jgi:fumarate reductase flavoprotein subunit
MNSSDGGVLRSHGANAIIATLGIVNGTLNCAASSRMNDGFNREERSMPKNENESAPRFDRRNLLKSVAATGAIATIAAARPAAAHSLPEKKATAKSWRDKPDPIDESLISDGGTYDIVVVGGGTAGLLCARVAASKGSSVAVIENQPESKYDWAGTEVGTVNSKWAMDHGAPKIDEDDFIREMARRNVIRHNPKRAAYFAKNSGRVLDWVIKVMSKEWLAETSHIMSCPPPPNRITDVSGWRFYHGSTIFRKMTDDNGTFRWKEVMRIHHRNAMADGAKWYFAHHAEICDVDNSGAVTGVVAKKADGTYVRFKARKAVALCSGDFSGNKEMVTDILDQLRWEAEAKGDLNLIGTSFPSSITRDGSSIKLGLWAGGHVEIGPHSSMVITGDPGTGVWHLQLDENGERFCDEAAGTALQRPKDGITVTLQDANWKKVLEMMPPRHAATDTAHTINWPKRLHHLDGVKPGPAPQNMELLTVPGKGNVYCANTVEELIGYLDCYRPETKKKALASITRYEELCEKGSDDDFGKGAVILKATALKDPPFYAIVSSASTDPFAGEKIMPGLVAPTGLDTDADGHVLNSQFKPIKGLFAAGNNAGGRFIVAYQSPMAGISLGMAMTDGYLLGERLAAL